MLTLERARELNGTMVTEDHLILHAMNVSYAMGAMAEHFGADKEHWEAVGFLHDYDYEKYPEEHLQHTEKELLAEGVDPEDKTRNIGIRIVYGAAKDIQYQNMFGLNVTTVRI